MTTIISRLYADARTAEAVAGALHKEGFPKGTVHVIRDTAGMDGARLGAATEAAYAPGLAKGHALVVVAAGVTPFGAAFRAMDVMDGTESIFVAGAENSRYIEETARGDLFLSVLTDHPRWFSGDVKPGSGLGPGLISRAFGMRILSQHRVGRSAMSGTRYMSRAFWPQKLLSEHRTKRSVMSGTRFMSQWFWPMALVSRKGS